MVAVLCLVRQMFEYNHEKHRQEYRCWYEGTHRLNDIEIESGPVRRRQPPGKRRAENISKTTPGPSALAKNISNELDAWTLFFTDEILGLILTYTNSSILRYISDNSDILMLTTMHDIVKVSRDERRKSHVMVFYDSTKGGVYVVDLHSSSISTRMKSRRWTMNAFSFSLDTARTNARTLYNGVLNISTSNFHFTWNIGKALVLPHIQRPHDVDRRSLPTLIVKKICTVLNIQNIPTPILPKPDQATIGGRCCI